MASPSRPWNPAHYPEVEAAGGLAPALEGALRPLWPEVSVPRLEEPFLALAELRHAGRSGQLTLATNERRFQLELRNQGVAYGTGASTSLEDIARTLTLFLRDASPVAALRASAPWLKIGELATVHEAGTPAFLTHAWKALSAALEKEPKGSHVRALIPLVEACRARPRLRALLPFTSQDRLCFSRCTGYPYTADCPTARAVSNGRFAVYGAPPAGHTLGEGDAARAAEVIDSYLPPGVGPAIHGTAGDVQSLRRR